MPAPSPGFDGDGFDGEGFDGDGSDGEGFDGEGVDGEGVDGDGSDGDGVDGEGVDGDGIDGDGDPLFLGLVGELPLQPVKTTSARATARARSFFMDGSLRQTISLAGPHLADIPLQDAPRFRLFPNFSSADKCRRRTPEQQEGDDRARR